VDLVVPAGYRVQVQKGDRVKNGSTPLAISETTKVGTPRGGP
jgi:hypothetical protein